MNEFRSHMLGSRRDREAALLGAKKPRRTKGETGLHSVAVPRSEQRTSNSRDGDRHRLAGEQVTLTHMATDQTVELINLSGGGAMVEGDLAPMLWDRVELHLAEGQSIGCIVRWIKGRRIGLEFAPETQIDCPAEELESLLREVVAKSFPEVAIDVAVPVEPNPPAARPKPKPESEHRRAERVPLVWSGQIHYDFTSTAIRLRNISSTGAMIECGFALPVGAEPLLDLGESGQIFAIVSWRRGDQIGLVFKSPYDMAQLARSKPAVTPVWRPPSHVAVEDDADAQSWEELSAAELRDRLEGFMKR